MRKGVKPVDWNMCIFCQSVKKSRLISVMTKQMSDHIIQPAQLDYKVNVRLGGVIDLIAAEAKYHLACLSTFDRSVFKTKQVSKSIDLAMIWLCQELHQSADKGRVILLNHVWDRYNKLAEESATTLQASFYSRKGTFKERLQSQVGDIFTFFQPHDRCITERKTVLIQNKFQA